MRTWVFATLLAVVTFPASASVVVTGTRVIYPESSREVDVRLTNSDKTPLLVQAWVDDGQIDVSPDKLKVPFILTPPMFRMEPSKGQTLRLRYTGDPLPKDRESVFWLDVLEVPPKPVNADGKNMLQVAFRTRIKIFFRPQVLQQEPDQAEVHGQLKWRIRENKAGFAVLGVDNPTPYYISFNRVTARSGSGDTHFDIAMVPPLGHVDLTPQQGFSFRGQLPATVSYSVIGDLGDEAEGTASILMDHGSAGKVAPAVSEATVGENSHQGNQELSRK
uniref:fimbria/pilus periplasmic chaperone n=1 Tax=Paraburkholderia aspalathi TaxID=1324617 RepID=UPI0038BA1F66